MDFSKLTKGDKIVLGAGLLLIIDLLFLPWHKITVAGIIDVTRTGVQSPNAIYGVLALLLALVMVVQVAVARLTTATLPEIPVPWGQVHLIAGIATFALLLLKLLVETTALGFGSYFGVLLAAALAFGGYTISQESKHATGGVL